MNPTKWNADDTTAVLTYSDGHTREILANGDTELSARLERMVSSGVLRSYVIYYGEEN